MNKEQLMQQGFTFFLNPSTTDQAAVYFEQVIQAYPEYVDGYFWLAYTLWQYSCDWERAEVIARRGIALNSHRADLHELLAWIVEKLHGYTQEYEDQLKIAISFEPTWLTPRCCLIDYYMQRKEWVKAQQEISNAIAYIKDYPNIPVGTIEWVYEYFITGKISDSWKAYIFETQEKLKK